MIEQHDAVTRRVALPLKLQVVLPSKRRIARLRQVTGMWQVAGMRPAGSQCLVCTTTSWWRAIPKRSTLPYLVRIPLGAQGVVLKAREVWPRTSKVYCHRATDWPADADVVDRVPVRSCVRRARPSTSCSTG